MNFHLSSGFESLRFVFCCRRQEHYGISLELWLCERCEWGRGRFWAWRTISHKKWRKYGNLVNEKYAKMTEKKPVASHAKWRSFTTPKAARAEGRQTKKYVHVRCNEFQNDFIHCFWHVPLQGEKQERIESQLEPFVALFNWITISFSILLVLAGVRRPRRKIFQFHTKTSHFGNWWKAKLISFPHCHLFAQFTWGHGAGWGERTERMKERAQR